MGNEPKVKLPKKRERADSSSQETPPDNLPIPPVNPVLANILYRSSEAQDSSAPSNPPGNGHLPPNQSQQEIARVAVGRGIRHNFSHSSAIKPAPLPARPPATAEAPQTTGEPETSDGGAPVVQANLSALKNNFQIAASANNPSAGENSSDPTAPSDYVPGSMRRDDSLVDLAMIPLMDDGNDAMDYFSSSGLSFIDFPWQDPSAPPGSG